ncbi:MAG: ATP-grasp domain-containing protein [Treponema sp.]|nr:ATP-grasp domain-containing protein [Treponema sp.]
MKLLFCENLLKPNTVDEAFLDEYNIAKDSGFEVLLYDFNDKNLKTKYKNNEIEELIYRGWMLNPFEYIELYNELYSKNYKLINNPTEYQNCHYLPDSLKYIENYTPKTIYKKINNENDINVLIDMAKTFNGNAVIIKDYVKSEKHYWDTACFVANSNDKNKLYKTIKNLIELKDNCFNEGIVIREYLELNKLIKHSKSSMPLSEEYRLFFYKNKLLNIFDYWEEGEYNKMKPNINFFENIAKTVESNFFTMDIAKDVNGKFSIIELGDGQVSGIAKNEGKNIFYKILKERQTSAIPHE